LHTVSDPTSGRYRWHLTAANGRVIAMSALPFEAPAAARAAFHLVATIVDTLSVVVTHPAGRLGWMWIASDDAGVVVANSARTYERRATCQRSYEQFLRVLR
jgi:uncharacterized protein YegP (UPF0339 family)